ncbi:hypothetical protein wCauA_01855 [Wolbachia endosymbiont of Carposina sasakii]|uniref:hypothetical protein n=1 Tax=Wolbachia endosymbiont of Carposina sasakii TaxID=2591635 RepID=UPI001141D3B4|nr:hypothetical protein [Wolbachia endosymbiont of Carposina sasakii]QDH18421.1 hypothetical protein wCauA_01855 [Wolbachia endosymbiont of Carposina sasakii]
MEYGLDHNYNKVLDTLKGTIKDDDNRVKARKHLRVERWLRVYIQLIEDFDEEKLKFFSDIFSDDFCWEGTGLKNKVVGERLTEEKNKNGKENPLDLADRYYLACKYCLEDKIPGLFEQIFMRFKRSALEEDGSDDDLRGELLENIKETSPIEAFWSFLINEQIGKLKEYGSIEGLQKSIQINSNKNWGEGIEFFYSKLHNDQSIYSKGDLLINAALSAVKGYKDSDIIEFCLLNMSDKQKKELLKRDFKENTYYAVLSELIDEYCFDSFKNLFDLIESNDLSFEQYGVILSSLSRKMLLSPDLAEQTKETIMYVWKHENFEKCRKSVFKDYSFVVMVTDLIVELRKESSDNENRKKEILEMLECVEHEQIEEVKNSLIHRMSTVHGISEEQSTEGEKLIEQLFSDLYRSFKDKKEGSVIQGNYWAGEPVGLLQSSFSLTHEKEHSVVQSSRSDVGAGEPVGSPQSSFSLTGVQCHVKPLSHSK